MHRAISDASLDVTVASHGPESTGRAASMTLFSRTRPLVCLDSFPFLKEKKNRGDGPWGIVDVIPLG